MPFCFVEASHGKSNEVLFLASLGGALSNISDHLKHLHNSVRTSTHEEDEAASHGCVFTSRTVSERRTHPCGSGLAPHIPAGPLQLTVTRCGWTNRNTYIKAGSSEARSPFLRGRTDGRVW